MIQHPRTPATVALVALAVLALAATASAAAPRVIKITATDDMRFSVTRIEAKAGETLKIQLVVKGNQAKEAMGHNFVLLDQGTEIGPFITQAAMARATGYLPAAFKSKILASTPLAGKGETVEVTFKVPAKPGSYTYVCTFPAHYMSGMKGTLVVQ